MKAVVGAACLIVVAAGVKATSALLIPLVLALFLAIISFPLVQVLQRRRVPRLLAVLLTMLTVLAAVVGPGVLIGTAIRQFAKAVPGYEARLREIVGRSAAWLDARNFDADYLAPLVDPALVFGFVGTALSGVVALLSLAFIVVLVSAFILVEAADLVERRQGLLPPKLRQALARITREMQVWLWVKTVISLATGLAAGFWTAVLGIEFPLLWGLLAFILNYIPNFGSIVAAFPPALIALAQSGPLAAVVVVVGYVVINIAFGSVMEPYLMGRQIGLSPLVVLLSVITWGWMWGAAGMLLAVPITMAIKFGLESFEESRWIANLLGGGSEPVA